MTQSVKTKPNAMSYKAFLEWADEDVWAEWVEGEVIILSPASRRHQDLAGFLLVLFHLFTEFHRLGEVLSAPFQMKTGPDLPGREPNILFVAKEHQHRLHNTYLKGPADLVIEIISPDRTRDQTTKYREYQAGGVREYWLLDPEDERATFYQLGKDGLYREGAVSDGVYESVVLKGLRLELVWLWQEPLPDVLPILKAWRLV